MAILQHKGKINFYHSISLHFIKINFSKKIKSFNGQTNRLRVITKATFNGQCASSRLELTTFSFD